MAELFNKQAKQYSKARPSYPPELFEFIASKTPSHDLVWDVGTGSGQAAQSLAGIYKEVIATDTSQKQLDFAPNLPNVRYRETPPEMSISDLHRLIAAESTLDLITVAQALHWFNLPTFYSQAKLLLTKPHGVLAAWCYTLPEVNAAVDNALRRFYATESAPHWDPARKLVDEGYGTIEFPFESVGGVDGTGPLRFAAAVEMDLGAFLTYIRSWSAYQTAKEKGMELLSEDVIRNFERVWLEDGGERKIVTFPVHLRIGKVGEI